MLGQGLKRLAYVASVALVMSLGAAGARADGNFYCPAGSGKVCWIFGCWCEDSGLNRVASARCPSLPEQPAWTWNAYVDVPRECAQPPAKTSSP